jgi:hypothetical protein
MMTPRSSSNNASSCGDDDVREAHVCFWHKADIQIVLSDDHFWG